MMNNCTYDLNPSAGMLDTDVFRATGILIFNRGVCASFSAANNILLNSFGVKCYTITGKTENPDKMLLECNKTLDIAVANGMNEEEKYPNDETNLPIKGYSKLFSNEEEKRNVKPGHAWNVIDIDGYLFQSDTTFDNGYKNQKHLLRTYPSLKRKSPKWDSIKDENEDILYCKQK